MRAPGHPQNCVLTEFAVDDLAAKLGIDPLVIRRKNLPPNDAKREGQGPGRLGRPGGTTSTTSRSRSPCKLSGWKEKWHPPGKGQGAGRSSTASAWPCTPGAGRGRRPRRTSARSPSASDGSVTAETSTQDLGTAQRTVTAIVVAEILGLEPTDVTVKIGESQYGCSSGSGGSTTCPSQAPAALLAAAGGPRRPVREGRRRRSGPTRRTWRSSRARSSTRRPSKEWAWKESCARLGMDEAKGKGEWSLALSNEPENANISSGQVGGVQVAEVLVDTETGVVRGQAHRRRPGLRAGRQQAGLRVAGGRRRHHGPQLRPVRGAHPGPGDRPAGQPGHGVLQARRHRATCRRSSST